MFLKINNNLSCESHHKLQEPQSSDRIIQMGKGDVGVGVPTWQYSSTAVHSHPSRHSTVPLSPTAVPSLALSDFYLSTWLKGWQCSEG
jgi:hypothetical protein